MVVEAMVEASWVTIADSQAANPKHDAPKSNKYTATSDICLCPQLHPVSHGLTRATVESTTSVIEAISWQQAVILCYLSTNTMHALSISFASKRTETPLWQTVPIIEIKAVAIAMSVIIVMTKTIMEAVSSVTIMKAVWITIASIITIPVMEAIPLVIAMVASPAIAQVMMITIMAVVEISVGCHGIESQLR
jgi:hypothetical protein